MPRQSRLTAPFTMKVQMFDPLSEGLKEAGLALPDGGPEDVTHLNDRELLLRIVLTQEHITQQIRELSASHQNLRAFVYGNGSPGLAAMVRHSQRWILVRFW